MNRQTDAIYCPGKHRLETKSSSELVNTERLTVDSDHIGNRIESAISKLLCRVHSPTESPNQTR
jgi:hypothetical protein